MAVGPSFQTRRQEAVDSLVQFVQAYPNAFPMIGDLLAENMDWPGAKQVAARLKKMLPPELQDDVNPQDIPPEVQARMQQIEGQLQQIQEAYEQAQEALRTDQVKRQAQVAIKERELAADAAAQERDLQGKLQLEEIRQQGESSRALAKIEQQRASEILQTEIGRLEQLIARNVDVSNRQEDRYERMMIEGIQAGSVPPQGAPPAAPAPGQGAPPLPPGGPPMAAPPLPPEDI